MGEAKRKRERMSEKERLADDIVRSAGNAGLLVETGWQIHKGIILQIADNDPRLFDIRLAFMAGAEHVFTSLIGMMDEGDEITDGDMKKMALLDQEIGKIRAELELAFYETKGTS